MPGLGATRMPPNPQRSVCLNRISKSGGNGMIDTGSLDHQGNDVLLKGREREFKLHLINHLVKQGWPGPTSPKISKRGIANKLHPWPNASPWKRPLRKALKVCESWWRTVVCSLSHVYGGKGSSGKAPHAVRLLSLPQNHTWLPRELAATQWQASTGPQDSGSGQPLSLQRNEGPNHLD